MYEREIVQEIMVLFRTRRAGFSPGRKPKVTLKLPDSMGADAVLLARCFQEERQGTAFDKATLCIDSCSGSIFCHDCGRQYRGPFLYDICQRCSGSHFESDDHLQVSVEAPDRRAPHKGKKDEWRVTMPAR